MESTVFTLLFVTAGLLGVSAILTLVPMMRRFEKEGRKVGFDFYSLRNANMGSGFVVCIISAF